MILDNRDDRREIWTLLNKLPPRRRVDFLRWACGEVSTKGRRPTPDPLKFPEMIREAYRTDYGSDRLTSEVYLDLWLLVANYQLSEQRLAVELEKLVRSIR